jgi:glycosyltransferase involved in cell wall biosynthesis
MVSTDGCKKKPFSFFVKVWKLLAHSDDVFIILSTEGTKYLLPIINLLNSLWHRRLFYAMVGIGTFKFETGKRNATNEEMTFFVQHPDCWKPRHNRIARNLKKMKKIFVQTPTLVRMCETIYGLKNALYLNNFRPSSSIVKTEPRFFPKNPEAIRFVFFARVCQAKGVDDMITAYSLLSNEEQGKCYIDLFGMVQGFSKDWFESITLPSHFAYKGVLLKDKPTTLSQYDCMIFPTRYIEGVPGTIIDCRYAGLPLLASNFTFAKDLINDGKDGIIYQYGNPKALAAAMASIIDDCSILEPLAKASAKRACDFSEDQILPIFESALFQETSHDQKYHV